MSIRDDDILPRVLQARARSDGDRPFLIDTHNRQVTYGQFWARVSRARRQLAETGVEPGTVVATLLPASIDAVVLWVAVSAMRAIEAPLNTALHGELLRRALEGIAADVLVVDASLASQVQAVLAEVTALRAVLVIGHDPGPAIPTRSAGVIVHRAAGIGLSALAGSDDAVDDSLSLRSVACLMYTSGTTGQSKPVVVSWRQLIETAVALLPDLPGREDSAYVPAPLFHVGGKGPIYLTALTAGRAVIRPSFRTREFWPDVISNGCTVTYLGAAMANFLLDQEAPGRKDHRLRDVLMVPVIPRIDEFRERFGVRVCTAYNMTELSCPIVSGWLGDHDGSSGRLRPGWQARIVNENDYPVPDGVAGELVVRPDQPWTIFTEYLRRPDETALAWRNLWFHTGDSFRVVDGEFYFVDRVKDAIRRRGENISSAEVEDLAARHPAVAESAAVGVVSEFGEEEVLLCVRPVPGEVGVTPAELHSFCGSVMPRFMVPRYIQLVADFPRTPNGKVRKADLRAAWRPGSAWDALAPLTDRRRGRRLALSDRLVGRALWSL
jgi:crotonobetaine/carnitine-CoA ligase